MKAKEMQNHPEAIKAAHLHSANHRDEIQRSDRCGCFYCCRTFSPDEIEEWVDEDDDSVGTTALCPKCGIDSVIGSASGFELGEAFLRKMKTYWF